MGPESSMSVRKTIVTLWDVGAIGGLTDAQLLEQFVAGPEQLAEVSFAELVERHGPMVRRVCRDLLGNPQEAQDAAQAVFLVLARKARSIRKPESIGSWLYGVAVRLARRARAEAARRREAEWRGAEAMAERIHRYQAEALDLHIELHEEIERLPEKYRNPIILCYFQGHSHEQVSQRLGWPVGTVHNRLHRAREQLRMRLSRRGADVGSVASVVVDRPESYATAAPIAVEPDWAGATAAA